MALLHGQVLYGEASNNVDFFLAQLVESQPAPYREFRDFLERMLLPSAEDLDRVHNTFDLLDTYVYPESAPEEWVRWTLTEWMGWTLIPDGYPLNPRHIEQGVDSSPNLRRLLKNLHLHIKRRYTVVGVRELLREFGIIAEVYDRAIYTGGYYGTFGSRYPLRVRVRVLGYEPFFSPKRVYAGGYVGGRGLYAFTTRQIITEGFVMDLIHWSRAAGVEFTVEWVCGRESNPLTERLEDDDEIII